MEKSPVKQDFFFLPQKKKYYFTAPCGPVGLGGNPPGLICLPVKGIMNGNIFLPSQLAF